MKTVWLHYDTCNSMSFPVTDRCDLSDVGIREGTCGVLLEGGAQANQQDKVIGYRLVQCLVGDVYRCDML